LCCAGVAVTDWQDIIKLTDYHYLAATPAEAIALAINAGVDMSMVPYDAGLFAPILAQLVANGTISEARIDESVRRVLQLKIDVGLFQDPIVPPALAGRILGGPADQALSLNTTRKSITLLQNNVGTGASTSGKPVLPLTGWLPKAGAKILVVGPAGDPRANLCGGWSLQWGGQTNCVFQAGIGSTIGQAVTALGASLASATTTVMQGVNFTDSSPAILSQVTAAAAASDVVILAIGEAPESETPGSTQDLTISDAQLALFAAINATATPVVTILVEPRPRVLGPIADGSAGIVMAYLPCLHGGQAIAEVLWGVTNPSGKLPLTYPRTTGDLDVYYRKPTDGAVEGVPPTLYHNPLFDFGSGLSYSTLSYDGIALAGVSSGGPAVAPGEVVNVTVTITNHGPYPAEESVLVFVRQLYRAAITPETRMLKAFQRVPLPVGATTTVTLPLDTSNLAYWTPSLVSQIDAGVYNVTAGGQTAQLTVTGSAQVRASWHPTPYGSGRAHEVVPVDAAGNAKVAAGVGDSSSVSGTIATVVDVLRAMGARASGAVAQDVFLQQVADLLALRLGQE